MEYCPFYSVRPLLPIYPEPENPSPAQKRWILVSGNSVFFFKKAKSGTVIMQEPLPCGLIAGDPVYLGIRDEIVYYAGKIEDNAILPDGWELSPVRELSGQVLDTDMAIAAYAVRILDFDRSHSFCGSCGAKTRPLTTERARICTECSRIVYPRISPAIIVLIKKGEEILLARSPRFPSDFFSILAGFNEPGENLEQTVHREVGEEVGITVRNLRYFGSEPWPFPDSLMVGFVADYAGGEIQIDNQEIIEAGWFTRDNLPSHPKNASISGLLIEAWIQREI
ncbi:MAG: NAD(+) diphosphatase [Methanomicrobiales archaeon]|nr:NAD(+) diphosphatase [Methanomicrobiales archaeon]